MSLKYMGKYEFTKEGYIISPNTNRPIIPAPCPKCGGVLDRNAYCVNCDAQLTPLKDPPYTKMIPVSGTPCKVCDATVNTSRQRGLCFRCLTFMKLLSSKLIPIKRRRGVLECYLLGMTPTETALKLGFPPITFGKRFEEVWSKMEDTSYLITMKKMLAVEDEKIRIRKVSTKKHNGEEDDLPSQEDDLPDSEAAMVIGLPQK